MVTTLKDKISALDAKRRAKIETRTAELIAEEMSLRDLRKALEKTQVSMAKALGIKQEGVSRIEQRSDLLLSTLRGYVEAMGGELHLIAEFPDRPPVEIKGVNEVAQTSAPKAKKASKDRRVHERYGARI